MTTPNEGDAPRARPIEAAPGAVTGHLERLLAESESARSALAELEMQFRSVQDLSPDASLFARAVRDDDGRITDFLFTYANAATRRVLLGRDEDVVGRTMREAFPESVAAGRLDRYAVVVETGEMWLEDVAYRRGSVAHGLRVTAVKVGDGVHIGAVDLSERIRSAEERERLLASAHAARAEAESARDRTERLQRLTAALAMATSRDEVTDIVVSQGVAATEAAGASLVLRAPERPDEVSVLRRTSIPDSVYASYGRVPLDAPTPGAFSTRTGEPIFIADRARLHERFSELAEVWDAMGTQSIAVVPVWAGETRGAVIFTFDTPRALSDADRRFFLTFGEQCAQAIERVRLVGADRAARADAEAARADAEQANRAKSDFLAVMSHELRTPLNAIGGYTQLLELGVHGPVTPEQHIALERIQRSQRHLLGLINSVLNYSRAEAGAVQYAVEDVPLDEVLATCEALTAPQVRAKRLRFRYAGCDPRLSAQADREKVQQVVLNLLSNAVKFTEPGGSVTLDCLPEGDLVAVRVSDTGRGIAADQLERVFQPFVQVDVKLTRTHEGTGLGLAISRDLARGMGGDLTVASELGAGSTFTLTLPASQPASGA